jgi:hypothetical protein
MIYFAMAVAKAVLLQIPAPYDPNSLSQGIDSKRLRFWQSVSRRPHSRLRFLLKMLILHDL